MMQKTILIAGTSAGVGKTVVTLAIAAYYQEFCQSRTLAVLKPIDTGSGDRHHYQRILSLSPSEDISQVCFDSPLDPPVAAETEGKPINLADIWRRYQAAAQSHDLVLMEAVGGLGTPLTPETTVADLAWDWRLPTVLVVPVEPGAVGQAIAHVALARQCRVHLRGIVLNCLRPLSSDDEEQFVPVGLIQSLTQVPVLGRIPFLEDVGDHSKLAHVASDLDIERILPSI
jgi:dethiobiotin synthetase